MMCEKGDGYGRQVGIECILYLFQTSTLQRMMSTDASDICTNDGIYQNRCLSTEYQHTNNSSGAVVVGNACRVSTVEIEVSSLISLEGLAWPKRQVASVELLQAMHSDRMDALPVWALGAGPLLHLPPGTCERKGFPIKDECL